MGVINKSTAEINELLDKVEGMPEEGVSGKTPVLETGETTTLDPGKNATSEVLPNGTDESGNPKYKLNFGIPRGADGAGGSGGGTADSVEWKNVLNKPTWVNSSTKPSYTAAEVGALPSTTTIPSKTSELNNDSGFVKSKDLKTINGNSLIGSGNIETSGTGCGIADAPLDGQTYGRKNGAWAAITSSTGGSVDITGILMRLSQIADIGGTCTNEDYNILKGYADNGALTYINPDGTSLIVDVKNVGGNIQIVYSVESESGSDVMVMSVSSSKQVTISQNTLPWNTNFGSGLLGEYVKASSYSAITKNDSISDAIGKLEAGISTGGGSDDIYYLPNAVLTLDSQATKEEIVAAFGGLDKRTELINAIKSGKKIYIQGNETYSSIPVSAYNFFNFSVYISFIRQVNISSEIVNISFAYYSSISIIYPSGYKVSSTINSLTSSSTSAEISSVLGGIEGVKELEKAIKDDNSIYTHYSVNNVSINPSRLNLSVLISNDDSKYTIIISGVQGDSILEYFPAGYLYIEYDIASNTFICQRFNNTGISFS